MPYLFIENFEAGLDTRKSAFTAPPGSARVLRNAHITRGKEVEQRKAFAQYAALPADTIGIHAVQDQLYTFGSGAEPADLPVTVNYQQLPTPYGGVMSELHCAENFAGKIYAIAEFDNGVVHHYYDGAFVSDWETLADDLADTSTVASALSARMGESDTAEARTTESSVILTSVTAGDAFVVAVVAGDMTAVELQAAQAAQAEVRATASFEITGGSTGPTFNTVASVDIDGTELLGDPVGFDTDVATTAAAVAARINAYVSGYSASASAGVVTITAPANLGASANGRVLTVTPNGDVTVGNVQNMSGGADPVPAVQQITRVTVNSYTAGDTYTVSVDGVSYSIRGSSSAMPTTVRAVKDKMYAVTGSLLFFSGFAGPDAQPDPTQWINDDGSTGGTVVIGAGFINMATQYSGSEDLVGVGVYQDRVAAFSRRNVQIWNVDPDPALNSPYQTLLNVGALAPRSIIEYGDIDIFFLGRSGVRSLRARDSSNLASASDVGVAIDNEIAELLADTPRRQVRRACAVVEPEDSRYLLAVGEQVYVFSNFPGSRVSAWSTYTLGGTVEAWAVADSRLYCRIGDDVLLYGGVTGNEYDASYPAVLETPFLDASNPATVKQLEGLDAGIIGTWKVEIATEPDNPDAWEEVARINRSTYGSLGRVAVAGHGTHFSLRVTSLAAEEAVVGNLVVHYRETETS